VERILLVLMLPIGDTLFATPTIRAVRRRYPEAHIAALVFPTNAAALHANEDLDEIILHPTGQTFTVAGYARFLYGMWRRRFTISIEFRPYVWWLSVACGVLRRLSLDIPVYQWFIPIGKRPWRYRHAIDNFATLVRLLGLRVDSSQLTVRTTDDDRRSMVTLLRARGIGDNARVIALHPGGEGFRGMKRWESGRFAVLGDLLARKYDARVVIVGGRDELALAREVTAVMREPAVVLNGAVSLRQAVALLERCYLFVGSDSAPLHMAASIGIPTVGIFGPTSVANYYPVGPRVEVARSGIVCSPCFYFVGSHPVWAGSHCRVPTCLHTLSVETVMEAAERALADE
jgi:ADP-heptose:LPS heptosyltransferase